MTFAVDSKYIKSLSLSKASLKAQLNYAFVVRFTVQTGANIKVKMQNFQRACSFKMKCGRIGCL